MTGNEYMKVYMIERYHRRRSEAIKQLGGHCVGCGSNDRLQFDHVDPSQKSFDIGSGSSVSEVRWQAELAKCVLRCKPCHVERTRQQLSVPHGGGVSGKRNCPCPICKKAKNSYMKKRRRAGQIGKAPDF